MIAVNCEQSGASVRPSRFVAVYKMKYIQKKFSEINSVYLIQHVPSSAITITQWATFVKTT